MPIFSEIHHDLPREAPGSTESTLRALSLIEGLPSAPAILDVGCGPGAQTIDLARATGGRVVAIDIHRPFLDELRSRAAAASLAGRIEPRSESMFSLEFPDATFDLLWAEGSIFIIGFERGLVEWRRFVKAPGFVAVTELSWLTNDPPDEARELWEEQYPGIRSVQENLELIRRLDYTLLGHFTLPERDWWDGYYGPLERRIAELRTKYARDEGTLEELAVEQREIDVYRRHSGAYGYEFYVLAN